MNAATVLFHQCYSDVNMCKCYQVWVYVCVLYMTCDLLLRPGLQTSGRLNCRGKKDWNINYSMSKDGITVCFISQKDALLRWSGFPLSVEELNFCDRPTLANGKQSVSLVNLSY